MHEGGQSPLVVLAEDDPAVTELVMDTLRLEGFRVRHVADGDAAVAAATAGDAEVVILDLGLPRLTVIEALRRIRAASDVPVLILSGRDGEADRVRGLELGADDYVTKPFSVAELAARVRALIRRREMDRAAGRAEVVRHGDLELDLGRLAARVAGAPVRLTATEFRILALMVRRGGRLVTQAEIMREMWDGRAVGGGEGAVYAHISGLRRKLPADRIVTVPGEGYRLSDAV
ncbi:MAG: response regulator transcription factor [Thermoleophilia bacterium]